MTDKLEKQAARGDAVMLTVCRAPGVLAYFGGHQKELDRQINEAMRVFYNAGCRRFRFTRMARTGDDTKVMVTGS